MFLVEKVHVYDNKNARVFTEDGSFMQGDVVVKDGRFDSVLEKTADTDAANDSAPQEIRDASGLIMIPGLVDIHFHGCKELICVTAPQRRLM